MKRKIRTYGMVLLLISLFSTIKSKLTAQEVSVSYQTFYNDLSPYGNWVAYPNYGYCWHPGVANFRPYSSSGHWVWTDEYGWMWTSDYNWGWATFHYGRWLYDDAYGWMWVPGYEWSPAWVEWRTGGDYYGWAPLGPGVNIGVNFSLGGYSAPYNYWCFVPRNHILSDRVYNYCLPASRNTVIIGGTAIVNNYRHTNNVFVTGPARTEVERYAGTIHPVSIRQSARPGRPQFAKNTVSVYRPQVQRNNVAHMAPKKFEKYDHQKSTAQQSTNAARQKTLQATNNARKNAQQRQNSSAFQRQQEQKNIQQQRNANKAALARRQSEMRQKQERNNAQQGMLLQRQNQMRQQQKNTEQRQNQLKEQHQRNTQQQRQNEMRQQQQRNQQQRNQQQNAARQQQRNNHFQQSQRRQPAGNGRDRDHHR